MTGPYNITTFDGTIGKDTYEVVPAPAVGPSAVGRRSLRRRVDGWPKEAGRG